MEELVNRLYALYMDAVGTADASLQMDSGAGHAYLKCEVCGYTFEVSVLGHKAVVCVTRGAVWGESVFDSYYDDDEKIRAKLGMMVEEA